MKDFLRDYVAGLFTPTPLIGFLLVVGLIFLFRKKERMAKILLTTATALMLIFGFDPVTEFLLNHTENEYPALKSSQYQHIKYVVVLAGGFIPAKNHPLTTELTQHTLTRLVEGVRIQREIPGSMLVVTGKGWHEKTEAEAMREMAIKLGVMSENIIVEPKSNNTREHTEYLRPILKDQEFILVTSAIHIPRAVGLFKKAGYKFIPAPTAHILTGDYEIFNNKVPFSKGDNLAAADMWFIEFWARTWARIKGEI